MSMKTQLTYEALAGLLQYDPENGSFTWKRRGSEWFETGDAGAYRWNQQYAGRPALTAVAANGYKYGTILGQKYYAHRIAYVFIMGVWPDGDIDHINGKRGDNRASNLRLATRSQNCRNVASHAGASSKYLGVSQGHRCGKWRAHILGRYLGTFESEEAAARAYDAASIVEHGEFARLNFPRSEAA